ncbi:MAG: outer membrane protein assembly factor BamA [Deltaproteobacteria bacterium]|nr:outer membrane protein assembly factor BamA [Deltaproteobacteria bacterium]
MVNYNRTEQELSLNRPARIKPVKRIKYIPLFMLLLFCGAIFTPALASGMDKIVVIPFMVTSTESEENLNTTLQKWFSSEMSALGYEVSKPELVNNILGDDISYSEPEKQIIPLARANAAKWVIIGEYNQKEGDIQLNVRVLDTDTSKSLFSVMMVENDKNNIPASLKKIAESLNSQMDKKIVVSDIIIEGNKRVNDDAILMIMESRKGEPFDQVKLDRDLRTIYKMGFFDDVNLVTSDSSEGKLITFNLVEKPTIIKISFQGNKQKKDEKLTEELGMKAYSVLNHNEVRQSINRLTEFYKNDGYYNVEIQEKIKELPDNEVTLTYVIKEGEKVLISDIEFRGNKVFKSKKLKKEMLTKKKSWVSWFTDSGVLDKKKLEYDVGKLGAFYDSHGYIKTRVGEPEVVYDKEEEELRLIIDIVEGEQYFVNDIIVEGDLLRPADELRRLIEIKKGDPFSRQVVHTEIQKIKGLYGSLGYAYAEVTPSQKFIEGTNLVDIPLMVEKKKKVRIERINIFGNEITKDKVLRRELKIKEGEYFDSEKLARSRENLDRLEIFEKHEVKTRRGSSDDLMILDIEGEEQLQRSISFSAGYGGYEKFMFQLQFDNNNLFGRGQNFSIEAMAGSRTTRFNATFTEPWMFDRPVRGSISAYNWDRDYDIYTREQMGGNTGLSFLLGLDDYTRGSVFYTYDKTEITDVYSSTNDIQEMAGEKYLTSSMIFGIERNSKDKWWDTTKGSLNSFTFEYAGGPLGGDVGFNKYVLNSTWYLPLFKGTVLVASGELGYIEGRSGVYLPVYEKFRIGGIDTVRGYEWGTISPLDPTTYDELGGDKMWLYKIEYRVPFAKGKGVTGLVFFDAGNAFRKNDSWKRGAGASVGFGIRWYSPMGPMRLEYGFKLKDRSNDTDSGKFEFKIGGSF